MGTFGTLIEHGSEIFTDKEGLKILKFDIKTMLIDAPGGRTFESVIEEVQKKRGKEIAPELVQSALEEVGVFDNKSQEWFLAADKEHSPHKQYSPGATI